MTTSIASSGWKPVVTTRAERYSIGKTLRKQVPRSSHAAWSAAPDRPDPMSLLEESNRSRLDDLVWLCHRSLCTLDYVERSLRFLMLARVIQPRSVATWAAVMSSIKPSWPIGTYLSFSHFAQTGYVDDPAAARAGVSAATHQNNSVIIAL